VNVSLKRELESASTPLRQWLDAQPMRIRDARAEFVAACQGHTPLLPAYDGRIDWTLLGNASGLGVVWHLDQTMPPAVDAGASFMGRADVDPATGAVTVTADWFDEFAAEWTAGPTGDPIRDGAVATIAGVFERLTRRPYGPGDDPIHDLVHDAATFDAALDGIPEWIAVDVAAVSVRGAGALDGIGPLTIGPSFAGSALVGGADADVVAAGTLWDVKSSTKVELRARDVHQLLGYTLLDFDDAHEITRVGICSSRYGVAHTWDVEWLLGRPVADARVELEAVLVEAAG
jgi:hypothetical protein